MQTSKQKEGELLLETRSKIVTTTVKDISEKGITLEFNSTGHSTGKYNSEDTSTVTVWMKTDGTSEYENKGIQTTSQGDFIAVWGKGTGKTTGPGTQAWEGEVHFMTQSPKLVWLNNVKGWAKGVGNQAKGESSGKIFQQK